MDVGIIGLGRMGGNMAARWIAGGHRVVGYSRSPATVQAAVARGVHGANSVADLTGQLPHPRVVWLMVPAPVVDSTLDVLLPSLASGDIVVDGGNSYYRDSMARSERLRGAGVHFVDAGTSGGVWGLTEGYSLMVGGSPEDVGHIRPLLQTLAPGPDRGWGHVGPVGAGHFVKMVHNGIEYGLMESYAEGLSVLAAKPEFTLDLHQVTEVWRYGSVVRSWLLDLAAQALAANPKLTGVEPFVSDSGEGRWTVQEGLDLNVPTPAITVSLLERIRSREQNSFADRMLALLRHEFGGHAIKTEP